MTESRPTIDDACRAAGGKAAGLVRLAALLPVPQFAVLECCAFRDFLEHYDLLETFGRISRLASEGAVDDRTLFRFTEVIVSAVAGLPFPLDLQKQLVSVEKQVASCHRVARSSAAMEDGSLSSWAGQFVSVFGVESVDRWSVAVRCCWASLARAMRSARVFAHHARFELPAMGVVLQAAVDARAAGVVFSQSPGAPRARAVAEATWGLGGPLVAGEVNPERWILTDTGDTTCTRTCRTNLVWILDTGLPPIPGSSIRIPTATGKPLELRKDSSARTGVWSGVPLYEEGDGLGVLSEDEARHVLMTAEAYALSAGQAVDLEWAIDRNGQCWWLQARPDTSRPDVPARPIRIHPEPRTRMASRVIAHGTRAASGRADGPGWWWPDSRPPSDAGAPVLFKETTDPRDVKLLLTAAGLATRDGGLLSHSAILSRELGIPCLVDVSPFPPEVTVTGTALCLDTDSGKIYSLDQEHVAVGTDSPRTPVLRPRSAIALAPSFHFCRRRQHRRKLRRQEVAVLIRSAAVPGLVDPVTVLPDLRCREAGIGFPIGISFRSVRFHPTAVCDWGDGFRLAEIEGVPAAEVIRHADLMAVALNEALERSAIRDEVLATIKLPDLFASGVRALASTLYEETRPCAVERGGCFDGGDYLSVPALQSLAEECFCGRDQSAHFLEICAQGIGDAGAPDLEQPAILAIHTGSAQLGDAFLNFSVELGADAALLEGIDDPDSIVAGYWGLDITRRPGRSLLANAIGLVNYSFARRLVLQHVVEAALSTVLRRRVAVRLLSDVAHSAARIDGDALLYQQGVQILDPEQAPIPLLLAGAPRVNSFVIQPLPDGLERRFFPHGKTYGKSNPALGRRDHADRVAAAVLVDGESGPDDHDVREADAQTRESLGTVIDGGQARIRATLFPILCMRGRPSPDRKLISRS